MANYLEKAVMDLIGENSDSPDVFNDVGIAEIRSHLNDAIEEVAIITGSVKRVWHVPLKQYAIWYQVASSDNADSFAWFTSVWLASNKRQLEQTSIQGLQQTDAWWMISTGNPRMYAPIGVNKFAVWPAPSSSVDTLEITGVAVPTRYSNENDIIKLRKAHQWACVNRAVSEFWATRGDAQSAARFFKDYSQAVGMATMYPDYAERRWQYRTEKSK